MIRGGKLEGSHPLFVTLKEEKLSESIRTIKVTTKTSSKPAIFPFLVQSTKSQAIYLVTNVGIHPETYKAVVLYKGNTGHRVGAVVKALEECLVVPYQGPLVLEND